MSLARSRGWSSGASGEGVNDQSFAQWRGSPVTIAGLWADTTAEVQEQLPGLASEYANWSGDLDIAVGGTVLGSNESYAEAAKGAYLDRWQRMAQNLQRYRGDKQGVTYVRPFHEFNGSWYENWFVTPDNVEDYKAAYRLMARTVRESCPRCVMVWSPNNGSSPGAAAVEAAYPGDDVVDVISIDSYNANGNPVVTDAQTWAEYAGATKDGDPVGVEAWRQFAERHGKPIGFSEWGLNPAGGGGDNPEYIRNMNAWMSQHAARPGDPNVAGKVLFDVYFNVSHEGKDGFLIKDGPNPVAGRMYQGLQWGNHAATGQAAVSHPGWAPVASGPAMTIPSSGQTSGAAPTVQPQEVLLSTPPAPISQSPGSAYPNPRTPTQAPAVQAPVRPEAARQTQPTPPAVQSSGS